MIGRSTKKRHLERINYFLYMFGSEIENNLECKVLLKTPEQIEEATYKLTNIIQEVACRTTPTVKEEAIEREMPLHFK